MTVNAFATSTQVSNFKSQLDRVKNWKTASKWDNLCQKFEKFSLSNSKLIEIHG